MYGYEAIPEEWLNTLIKREEIEKLCERAERTWRNL
jgi:ADP-ribosylglycohydrolase